MFLAILLEFDVIIFSLSLLTSFFKLTTSSLLFKVIKNNEWYIINWHNLKSKKCHSINYIILVFNSWLKVISHFKLTIWFSKCLI